MWPGGNSDYVQISGSYAAVAFVVVNSVSCTNIPAVVKPIQHHVCINVAGSPSCLNAHRCLCCVVDHWFRLEWYDKSSFHCKHACSPTRTAKLSCDQFDFLHDMII